MKHLFIAGVAGIAALSLFSCKKEAAKSSLTPAAVAVTKESTDAMSTILQDLSPDTYLLTFPDLPANRYITQSSYGTFSDEGEFTCGTRTPGLPIPGLVKLGYTQVAINKFWVKTCPTMIPLTDVAKNAATLIQRADPKTFADLTITEISGKQNLLATQTFLTAINRTQPDAVDQKVLAGQTLGSFRLSIPQTAGLPYFTRGFYGTFDIAQSSGLNARGLTWADIIRRKYPNMIGCFDPQILKDIAAKFTRLDPGFAKLSIEEVGGGAIMGF
jgi:hypothetical protein